MNKSISLSESKLGYETTSSIMEDALVGCLIQETGQEQRPARMVGLNVLIFAKICMEAGWGSQVKFQRKLNDKRRRNG